MPDNAVYYYAAYGIAAVIYVAYAASLALRNRRVRREPSMGGVSSARFRDANDQK